MRPSMTSGDERPPKGALHRTLPFSFWAGSKLSGSPVSSEWPFSFVKQTIRIGAFWSPTGSPANSQGFQPLGPKPRRTLLLVDDAAGFHLEPRERAGRGRGHLDAKEQLVADRAGDGFSESAPV